MANIKILQLCAVDFTLKNLLLPLVDRLSAEGFEVHSACSPGPEIEELRSRGYRIRTVRILRRISPLSNLISVLELFRYIKQERFDVVHVHTPVAGILGRIAARLSGVPLIIYTAHGFYFHDGMPKWKKEIVIAVEKFMGIFFTDIIFTQSEEDRTAAIQRRIISPGRIFHIGNGVDIKKFDIENIDVKPTVKRRDLGIKPDARVIGFIGRIVREKGIVDLVEAFKKVLREVPGAVLLVIGDHLSSDRDHTTKKEVLSLIDKYGLAENIVFTGQRRDINELLAVVDVFVLPSYREGMPRSIIEAMAMGRPVVATDIRGCREEVVDGVTGLLVPVGDPESLAGAISTILRHEALALKMGRAGRARARDEFDEEKVLARQSDIIWQWLKRKRVTGL